jgi:hypothetical protein
VTRQLYFRFLAVPVAALLTMAASPPAPGERDGQVLLHDDSFVAWDAEAKEWLGPETFWKNFGDRRRGKNWGAGNRFPPYEAVGEHDTFLLQGETGPCLMYFFHTRWRRANDVWRWGDAFNEYGGCPKVFD